MAAKPRAPSGAEWGHLEKEPLQEHRREDAEQHRDHERQPTGHRPLPLTLTLLQIAFRAFAFMPLHTLLVRRAGPKHKMAYRAENGQGEYMTQSDCPSSRLVHATARSLAAERSLGCVRSFGVR
jgi:hypothetical protein